MTNDYGVCKPGSAMYKFECFALLQLGLFSLTTSGSPKLISKAVLK